MCVHAECTVQLPFSRKKPIFLWITAKFKRVDPPDVDLSLVNCCYFLNFTVISSQFGSRTQTSITSHVFYFQAANLFSLLTSGVCLSWTHCHNKAVRLKFLFIHILWRVITRLREMGISALLFLARVSCIPAAAEHTANIRTPRSQRHSEESSIVIAWSSIERHAVPQALSHNAVVGFAEWKPKADKCGERGCWP